MKMIVRATAGAVAMILCAPVLAYGYVPDGTTPESQIAKNCKGRKGAQFEACAAPIRESYQRYLDRGAAVTRPPAKSKKP